MQTAFRDYQWEMTVFEQYHSQNVIVSMIQESRLTSLPISAEEIKRQRTKITFSKNDWTNEERMAEIEKERL